MRVTTAIISLLAIGYVMSANAQTDPILECVLFVCDGSQTGDTTDDTTSPDDLSLPDAASDEGVEHSQKGIDRANEARHSHDS